MLCLFFEFSPWLSLDSQKFRALWLTGWRGVEWMTHCWWGRCLCHSYTWHDVASALPHRSNPQRLTHSLKSVLQRTELGAVERMSYGMLRGRAAHFQIISNPLKNTWSKEFSWILWAGWILFIRFKLCGTLFSFSREKTGLTPFLSFELVPVSS